MKKLRVKLNGKRIVVKVNRNADNDVLEAVAVEIANGMFADGEYRPYRKDFLLGAYLLGVYTDLDVDNMMTDDLYALIDNEDFYWNFKLAINHNQYARVIHTVDALVNARLAKHPLADAAATINSYINKFAEVMKTIKFDENFNKELQDFLDSLNKDK